MLVLTALVSAQAFAQELQKTAAGVTYKILTKGNGPKIKVDDIITFNFTQKNGKDSLLASSYTTKTPVKIRVQPAKNIGDLMDVFIQLSAKDSAVVYVPTDSIFKGFEQERPPFLPKGSALVFNIKIERVQSLEDAMAENTRMIDSLKTAEKTTLAAYLADKKPDVKPTASGLLYGVTKATANPKPLAGDTVYVNYVGRTLEGKVFDTSIAEEAQKAGIFSPERPYQPISFAVARGQMIPGWDEGLLLFNSGSKGILIIPSDLAYGAQGGGDVIKPFSTLVFDIELVKIKKAVVKAAVKKPSSAKKPGTSTAKKPATTTTKKPATTTAAPAKKVVVPVKK